MKKRRILVTLESRATYGYSKNVMLAMSEFPELELITLVTGMHLVPELGNSIALIEADGFPITERVPMHASTENCGAWSEALGTAVAGFARAYEKLQPDIILLSGDRIETFGLCVASVYMNIPTAHIQAGDKSGHIDDAARMAIGKLAHIHFASCEDSAERLRRMGEQPFRVFNVGAPQLDDIVGGGYRADKLEVRGATYDLAEPYLLLVQHSILVELDEAYEQMRASIDACLATGMRVFSIHPNSDLGYQRILQALKDTGGSDRLVSLPNLDRTQYLTLLANCRALVGNSSSGILEAPSFQVPVVNIGNRQRGRPQASNIFNCDPESGQILAAIKYVLDDPEFKIRCRAAVNPYGNGKSGRAICEILRDVPLDKNLLDKHTVY